MVAMKLDTSFFKNNKKLLPLFIGGGVLLLGVIVFVLYWFVLGDVKPSYVRVTNQTDSSFTVSWVSTKKSKGQVLVREDGKFLPGVLAPIGADKFYDDRDVVKAELEAGEKRTEKAAKEVEKSEDKVIDVNNYNFDVKVRKQGRYYVHSVTVSNLEADTEYSFRIGNGLKWYGDKNFDLTDKQLDFGSLTEGKQPVRLIANTLPFVEQSFVEPNPSYGLVDKSDGNENLLVFAYFVDGNVNPSLALSSMLNEDGGWYIDLSNARISTGYVWGGYNVTSAVEIIQFLWVSGNEVKQYSINVSLTQKAPAPTVTLSNDEDSKETTFLRIFSQTVLADAKQDCINSCVTSCKEGGPAQCGLSPSLGACTCGACDSWRAGCEGACNDGRCNGAVSDPAQSQEPGGSVPDTPPQPAGNICTGKVAHTCTDSYNCFDGETCGGRIPAGSSGGPSCVGADNGSCSCRSKSGNVCNSALPAGSKCVCPDEYANCLSTSSTESCGAPGQVACEIPKYCSQCNNGSTPVDGKCPNDVSASCDPSTCQVGATYKDGLKCEWETAGSVAGAKRCTTVGANVVSTCDPSTCTVGILYGDNLFCEWEPAGSVAGAKRCAGRTGGGGTDRYISACVPSSCEPGVTYSDGKKCTPQVGTVINLCVPNSGGGTTATATPDTRSDCGGSAQNPCNDFLGLGGNACDTGMHMTNDRCCSDGHMFCGIAQGCTEARCQSGLPKDKGCVSDADCGDPTDPSREVNCIQQNWLRAKTCMEVTTIPAAEKRTCADWCTKARNNQIWHNPDTGEYKTCIDPLIGPPYCADTPISVNAAGAGGFLSSYTGNVWADDLNIQSGALIINDPGLYTMVVNGEVLTSEVDGDETIAFYIDKNGNDVYDEGDEIVDANVIQIELKKEAEAFTYQFSEGYNYVSFPFVGDDKNNLKTMSAVLQYLNSKGIEATVMATYDGGWKAVDYREVKDVDLGVEGRLYGVNDFPINPGKGYVIRVINGGGQVSLSGYKVNQAVPVEMDDAWNLIGVHGLSTYDGYTADDLITSMKDQGIPVEIATQWIRGRYESRIIKTVEGTERKFGNDFPIEEYKAYFVQVNGGSGIWEPEKKE